MVVEDIFVQAIEVQSALEAAGAEVVGPFASSATAFSSFRQQAPDCALLDVNLDGSDSLGLAGALRAKGIPFLFFTGYDRDALPLEFADMERLEKPVDSARLLQAFKACCPAGPVR